MASRLRRIPSSGSVLARLIDSPDLVATVRALPADTFSKLVRHIGVEDAGEIVALATTEQLVAAFDEDLFGNDRPGEREAFDRGRFVAWLEVLLEAGDDVAAHKAAALSEDFLARALSSLLLVLDQDALLARMGEGDDDSLAADKAMESSLTEELDSYLLFARDPDGWDAALSLVLALDRDHHALLERVLERAAEAASGYIDDLDELVNVLTAAESLAEDVEAERESRRAARGHVEPQMARSFLALAGEDGDAGERDAVTRAYFRDLPPKDTDDRDMAGGGDAERVEKVLVALGEIEPAASRALPGDEGVGGEPSAPIMEALGALAREQPERFDARMEELTYLANVIVAGAELDGTRFEPAEAAEAALATVSLGAELIATRGAPAGTRATVTALVNALRDHHADALFRDACRVLLARGLGSKPHGFLRTRDELEAARQLTSST